MTTRTFALLALSCISLTTHAAQQIITGPAGSEAFGRSMTLLPNGNFVVVDPGYDLNASVTDVGMVRLYRNDGTLISSLRGTTTNDRIGRNRTLSGVRVLTNGNFVVLSENWSGDKGAATFVSGTTGLSGEVTVANSITGTVTGDFFEADVVTLSNGNYVVSLTNWDSGSLVNAGTAVFGNGNTGVAGTISTSNALLGANANCATGKVTALANGNYVVTSPGFNVGANFAAVTFGSGQSGVRGTVSATNSMVGRAEGDGIQLAVTPLSNDKFAVAFPRMDSSNGVDAGAVISASASIARIGVIDESNALFGQRANNHVGGVFDLGNGHCVVASPGFDDVVVQNIGAVTFVPNCVMTGTVSALNSLVGTSAGDSVGGANVGSLPEVLVLSDGDYAVPSPLWNNGAVDNAGAVTVASGITGMIGTVSVSNSIVGSRSNDFIGSRNVILPNGSLLVGSPSWDSATAFDVGAVSHVPGLPGISWTISATTALVGDQQGDQVGDDPSSQTPATVLPNGNYVVTSVKWHGYRGAFTFGNGINGVVGVVSATNSWVSDQPVTFGLGESPRAYVVATANSDYLAGLDYYANRGVVGFHSGRGGRVGVIASGPNTLIGGTDDFLGLEPSSIAASSTGKFAIGWARNDFAASGAGAIMYGDDNLLNGLITPISSSNSLLGALPNDSLGGDVVAQANGNFVVQSKTYDNIAVADAGLVMLLRGDGSTRGTPTGTNAVLGIQLNGGASQAYVYDNDRNQLIVGQPASNRIVRFGPGNATTTTISQIDPAQSLVGVGATFSVLVASSSEPTDGQVTIYASTGERCVGSTPSTWDSSTARFTCSIVFATAGTRSVHAEYTGSWRDAFSRSTNTNHTVVSTQLFSNGFE